METIKEVAATFLGWLNQPLPIIGVSLLFILIFLWKIFSSTSFGKKQIKNINGGFKRLEIGVKEVEQRVNDKLAELEFVKKELEDAYNEIKALVIEVCETSPNKKLKAIAERLKNDEKEERADSQTTSE